MIRVQLSEEALQDLNQGFFFYEAQEIGLGNYFLSSVSADIEGLKYSAGIHRKVYRDYYRLLSRIFPHGIFYTLDSNGVMIWAVIDLRRDPLWIREKLGK